MRAPSSAATRNDPAKSTDTTRGGQAWRRWFWPALVLICAVGGAIRFLILVEYLRENPFAEYLRVDALTYWRWAGRIAVGQLREATPFFSAPLYPYVVGVIRACGGGLVAVYVVQVLFDISTAAMLGWIGRARFNPAVGLLSAALFLLMLDPASFCLRILTCSLQLALIGVAWISLLAVQRRGSLVRGVLSGASLGLLSLAYPPAVLLLLALGPWMWWNSRRQRADVGRAVLAVVSGAVVIAPATLHNYLVSDDFFLIQSATGINFRQGNGPGATGVITMIPGTADDRETLFRSAQSAYQQEVGREGTWGEIDRYYRDQVFAFWRSDPARTFALAARKAYWFLTGRVYGDIYNPTLEIAEGLSGRLRLTPIHTAWLLPPALVALIALLRRPNRHFPELLLFVIPLLIVVVFWYSPRYRLPAIPVITVSAAWAIRKAFHWRQHLRWSLGIGVSLALSIGLGGVNRAVGFDGPDDYRTEFEVGRAVALVSQGKLDEAVARYREVLKTHPHFAAARTSLANALRLLGRSEESMETARQAVRDDPDSAPARTALGIALIERGQVDEAIKQFREAIRLNPRSVLAHSNLGNALAAQGRLAEALEHHQTAVRLDPSFATARFNLGCTLVQMQATDKAAETFRQALRFDPEFVPTYAKLGELLVAHGDFKEAADVFRRACARQPDNLPLANDLAWILATCPETDVRDAAEAVKWAAGVCQATDHKNGNYLDTLAAAYAEAGQFEKAVETARKAVDLAVAAGQESLAKTIDARRALYEAGKPYHMGSDG